MVISLEFSEADTNLKAIINETDPSNSAISVITDTTNIVTRGGYFSRETTRTEAEVLAKHVVVPKDKCGIPGSRERGINYLAATGALDQTFGADRNFCPQVRKGNPSTIITYRRCMLIIFTS